MRKQNADGMSKADLKAFVSEEVARQLASRPRVVPKSEKLRPAIHRQLTSNQPGYVETVSGGKMK